jgi:hypothetical protein
MSESASVSASEKLDTYANGLLFRVWVTRGVRFEANRRLEKSHEVSHIAISVLSVYVICIALLELLIHDRSGAIYYLFPLATIVAPIFILVMEKHLAGEQHLVRAERMERSAQRLQRLHGKLDFLIACNDHSAANLEVVRKAYDQILHEFPVSHDYVDYLYFQTLNPAKFVIESGFRGFLCRFRGRAYRYIGIWGIPLFLIVVPALMIAFAIVSVVPKTQNTGELHASSAEVGR